MSTGLLQDELRQRRPFRSAGAEAAVGLLRTADLVRRYFERVLEPFGVSLPQYNVLRVLRGAGPDGLPTLDVAERLIERAPGITRMMDRLEAKGWVRRHRSPEDRRVVVCRLTAAGTQLLRRADRSIDQADDEVLGTLTERQQRQLAKLLDRAREGLR